jgi:hypothetical protein
MARVCSLGTQQSTPGRPREPGRPSRTVPDGRWASPTARRPGLIDGIAQVALAKEVIMKIEIRRIEPVRLTANCGKPLCER